MKFPEPPSSGTVTSLMSPMQFTATAKLTASQSSTSTPELTQLDKQQFKDAFVYLLQVGLHVFFYKKTVILSEPLFSWLLPKLRLRFSYNLLNFY